MNRQLSTIVLPAALSPFSRTAMKSKYMSSGSDRIMSGDPAVLGARIILACLGEHRLGAAHVLDVLFRGLNRRQSVEVRGITVIVAQVALVDRLDVVFEAAVKGMR